MHWLGSPGTPLPGSEGSGVLLLACCFREQALQPDLGLCSCQLWPAENWPPKTARS